MAAKQDVVMGLQLQGATGVTRGLNKVQGGLNGVENAGKKANKMFRFMRGGTAQLGYQIQDIAVQLQGGQNAMLVFGQQGSQLASLMGPGGALIGALIAVGAALSTTFLTSTEDAADATENLDEKIKDLIKTTGIVTDVYRDYLRLLDSQKVDRQSTALDKYTGELEKAETKLEQLQKTLQDGDKTNVGYLEGLKTGDRANKRLNETISEQIALITTLKARIAFLSGEIDGTNQSNKDALKTERMLTDMRFEAAASLERFASEEDARIKKTTKARESAADKVTKIYNEQRKELDKAINEEESAQKKKSKILKDNVAEVEAAIKAEIAAATRKQQIINAIEFSLADPIEKVKMQGEAKIQALKAVHSAEEQETQAFANRIAAINANMAQNVKQAQINVLSATVGMFASQTNQLASFFDQASGIGKAFYLISQTMAAAQAIISGYAASMNIVKNMTALGADPATAVMMGQVAVGMGFATAGAIMGQTVAGFEGGGITFNGVRSGGMDGKGGRMAVVHPNEKITDLEKGGGMQVQPVNVTMNISAVDAKGIDKLLTDRRGLITGMVNKAINNQGRSSL